MFDIRDISQSIDTEIVRKIFGNKPNAYSFLQKLGYPKSLIKDPYSEIVKIWDYKNHKLVIRAIFETLPKYKNGLDGKHAVDLLLKEWGNLDFGAVSWPFSQGAFDDFVQRINAETQSNRLEKDEKVKIAAVKYRRIKEINTVRNDFLETLLFKKYDNIIPTLSHRKGVDFFIDGISYDQKVSKSPTNEFKKDFGIEWKQKAIENPLKVAEYLYRYQDEGRFGASPRLFFVFLDEDLSPLELEKIIDKVDLGKPSKITFEYKHQSTGLKTYQTFCYIILLAKEL